ncbi:uncharacterized mitochondrial protein AtMg00810-like [Solanum tuberosum]|uniref:uncharacterized mitochondrial protein AtMg00810-like n=1 Tax=Solanum tuberosum TaxID=4113 RepID=UPI00073A13C1|nr:PREDICTED: uncharacterized mitochondrial protein AtMg00810-like [Solanum tuberosum]
MGDGKTIPITHTGSTQIQAPDSVFRLSKTLCAPLIKGKRVPAATATDPGYLNYFLGVEVKKESGGLLLTQSKYILDILSELDMQDCKRVLTPICSGKMPRAVDGSPPANATLYRRTLSKFQYLSFTRPDISYAVNKLSHFMHDPTNEHWKAVKRILQYLKATTTSGLHILQNSYCNLSMYADAD